MHGMDNFNAGSLQVQFRVPICTLWPNIRGGGGGRKFFKSDQPYKIKLINTPSFFFSENFWLKGWQWPFLYIYSSNFILITTTNETTGNNHCTCRSKKQIQGYKYWFLVHQLWEQKLKAFFDLLPYKN